MTIKNIMAAALSAVLCVVLSAAAFAESLVPGGGAVGIRITTDGVVVAGVSEVETPNGKRSPAAEAGLKKGDVITRLGGADIGTAQDFKTALAQLAGSKTTVTIERGGKAKQLNITPAQDADGAWKLGLWLRDGVSGVGTLTFYDPETGVYGALGHSISDEATGEALPRGERRTTVRRENNTFYVEGEWLINLMGQINPDDYESLSFFSRVLQKAGVIAMLEEKGAKDGDTVNIYDFEFDFVK